MDLYFRRVGNQYIMLLGWTFGSGRLVVEVIAAVYSFPRWSLVRVSVCIRKSPSIPCRNTRERRVNRPRVVDKAAGS